MPWYEGGAGLAYLFGVNLLSAFIEGAMGFGGSLFFIAATVPVFGWSTSILADAILNVISLGFTSWLYLRGSPRNVSIPKAWTLGLLPMVAGTLIFVMLPNRLRSIPLIFVGVAILWRIWIPPRSLLPALGGLGIGLGNTEEPYGYLYFQDGRPGGQGETALFTAGLMAGKAALLLLIWSSAVIPDVSTLFLFGLAALPMNYAGRALLGQVDPKLRQRFVKFFVPVLLGIIILGAPHG